jgi:hypothetical protein
MPRYSILSGRDKRHAGPRAKHPDDAVEFLTDLISFVTVAGFCVVVLAYLGAL